MSSIQNVLQVSAEETEKIVFSCDWSQSEVFAEWLSQTYHFVKYTTRLLAMGASFAEQPIEDNLHYYFLKHLPEEHQHDSILIHDLKALNQTLQPVSDATLQFVENHKKDIIKNGSVVHMGYMIYLENLSIAVGPQLYKTVIKYHNPKACHFLKTHTQDDVDHVQGALDFCEKLSVTQKNKIINSILLTHEGYKKIFEGIKFKSQQKVELQVS